MHLVPVCYKFFKCMPWTTILPINHQIAHLTTKKPLNLRYKIQVGLKFVASACSYFGKKIAKYLKYTVT